MHRIYWLIYCLTVIQQTISRENSVNEVCEIGNRKNCGVAGKIIDLKPLEDDWVGQDKLFFIESSDSSVLSTRYLCAAESASVFSGLPVVILMTSKVLNVSANNASKHVLDDNSAFNITVRHINVLEILKDSPFGDQAEDVLRRILRQEELNIDSSKPWSPEIAVHISDAIRLAIIHKYGGWYADFDTMFFKDVKNMSDSTIDLISTDDYERSIYTNKPYDVYGHKVLGQYVANGIFRFSKPKSKFIELTIQDFVANFHPDNRSSGGSRAMTRVLRQKYCKFPQNDPDWKWLTVERYSAENCSGLQLIHPKYFYPITWDIAVNLYQSRKTQQDWLKFIEDAYSMDFFQSSSGAHQVILPPKYYGTSMPAYTALGPIFCPLSFFSQRHF